MIDLRAIRLKLNLTQLELAARLGVPVNTIARWERGDVTIAHAEVLRLALDHLSCRPRHKIKPESV